MSALFPEVEGRPGDDRGAEPVATPPPRVRPGLIGGPESLTRFGAAMGIPGKLRSIKIGAEAEIECEASFDGESVVHFALVPADRRAWMRAEGFAVVHTRASGPPPVELARAMKRFVRRYGHVPLEELARRVQPEGGDDLALSWDDASTLFYSYGAGKAWRTFTESNELYRAVCEEIHGPDVVAVKHEEHECSFNKVFGDEGSVGFFNTVDASGGKPMRKTSEEGLITDIEDLDVIKGGDARLSLVLESVADLPKKPSLVVIHNSCVPVVTGDDLGAAAAKAEAKVGVPFVVLGQENNPQEILLQKIIDDPAVRGERIVPHRVNLLGFPEMAGRRELVAWLEGVGVEVGASVFPDLSPESLVGFGEAGVNVAYGWDRYAKPISGLTEVFPRSKLLRPPAPFGLDGSRDWLLAVARAAGRGEEAEARWSAERSAREARFEALKARVAGYRLGFISDRPDWRGVFAEARTMGAPLLDVADTFGFAGLDVLAFSATGAVDPAPRPSVRVVPYDSAASLREAIAASTAVAFYSEIYFDRRLSRLGKNIFSLRDIDCGLEGAERTLERLLVRCRTPFYRLYGSLLGDAFPKGAAS